MIATGVWQASGFAMALFLAGLRSVDADLLKAAQIEARGRRVRYCRVVFPTMGPIFVAVLVMLLQFAIKTYDLVVALTGGGPGLATTVPTIVVYDFMFQRGELARGSAAAVMLLARSPSCWCPTRCIAAGSPARRPMRYAPRRRRLVARRAIARRGDRRSTPSCAAGGGVSATAGRGR